MNTYPLEEKEQAKFVVWAREQGITLSSLNQSTYTNSWKQIAKLSAAGTSKGIPDLILAIPPERRNDGKWKIFFIEMKRVKGSHISKEQRIWLDIINNAGIDAKVCKGCKEAIIYTKQFLEKEPERPSDENLTKFINNL